jgi:hypothetical protein
MRVNAAGSTGPAAFRYWGVVMVRGPWRIALIVLAILMNGTLAFVAMSPTFVSYAEMAPSGITCLGCETPDVQWALTRATKRGRDQILSMIEGDRMIILGLAALNVVLLVVATWTPRR